MTTRLMSRLAALGAAAAVGSVALVSVGAPAEAAASGKATYTCSTVVGDQTLAVTTKIALPAKAKKGTVVKGKKVTLTVVLPESLVGALNAIGVKELSGTASGVKAKVGSTGVALQNVGFKATKVPASGTMTVKATGKTAAFTLKKPGTYAISLPTKFKFTSTDQNGGTLTDKAPCSLDSGQKKKIGTITVAK